MRRRQFLFGLGATTAAAMLPVPVRAKVVERRGPVIAPREVNPSGYHLEFKNMAPAMTNNHWLRR